MGGYVAIDRWSRVNFVHGQYSFIPPVLKALPSLHLYLSRFPVLPELRLSCFLLDPAHGIKSHKCSSAGG